MTKTDHRPFHGRVAFVSGGSRGIGYAIAQKLADSGCDIVFSYLRSRSDSQHAESQLARSGVKVSAVRANMGNAEQVKAIFEMIRENHGRLDFLIHNAATGDLKPIEDMSLEEWKRSLEINLDSLFLCSKLAAPLMRGRGGRIISISSHGSRRCLPNYAAVGVAKSGIESLSRYLAVELAPKGIIVNVIMAGTTETQSLKKIPMHEVMMHEAKSKTPVGRIGHPVDIANVAYFLCTEEARWIVGQTIVADGGYSLLV